jgi:hypothetical protein
MRRYHWYLRGARDAVGATAELRCPDDLAATYARSSFWPRAN